MTSRYSPTGPGSSGSHGTLNVTWLTGAVSSFVVRLGSML